MDVKTLQRALVAAGQPVTVDGLLGPKSRAAVLAVLKGPIDRLSAAQIAAEATALGVPPPLVGAVYDVESGGRGMDAATGLPIILYEPHVFSRLTGHVHDAGHPSISYRAWKTRPYPKTQTERWDQMLAAMAFDPGAALQSASWGLGQVMGFNFATCGFGDVWAFARRMASGEGAQFGAMLDFIEKKGLLPALKRKDWRAVASGYNGSGQVDLYAGKLAKAYAKRGGQ